MKVYEYTFRVTETIVYEITSVGTDQDDALDDALAFGLEDEDIVSCDIEVELEDKEFVGEGR